MFPGSLDEEEEQQGGSGALQILHQKQQQNQQQQPLTGFFTQGFGKLKNTLEKVLGKEGKAGPGDEGDTGAGSVTTGRRLVLVEADRTRFEQLALVTSCAGDHLPDTYYQALQQLYAAALAEDPSAAGRRQQQAEKGAGTAPGLKSLLSVGEEGLVADSKAGETSSGQEHRHGKIGNIVALSQATDGGAGSWAGGTAADGVDVLPPAVRSAALNAAAAQEAQAAQASIEAAHAGAHGKERSSLMGDLVSALRLV
jgi:hypothetical protein